MSGKLSFTGDTIKAMSLQRIQKDLNRLYTEARAEVGNLDALFERSAHEGPAQSNPPPAEAAYCGGSQRRGRQCGSNPRR